MHRRPAHVLVNEPLTPSVRRLVLAIDDGPFEHAPGQAVVLEVHRDGATVRAPYSIASAPGERGESSLELAVARDAPGSRSLTMHDLAPGDAAEVVGPVGSFLRTGPAADAPALFVAAGTGLSPLRSMIAAELARTRAAREGEKRLVLLFGARSEKDILWRDDLEAWSARWPHFSALITLSRPTPAWTGRRGWVQAHLAEAAALAGPDAYAFVCGPEPMVEDAMRVLSKDHLPEARVLRERYG